LYDVTHQKVNEDQQDPVSDGPTLTVHKQTDSLSDEEEEEEEEEEKKKKKVHSGEMGPYIF